MATGVDDEDLADYAKAAHRYALRSLTQSAKSRHQLFVQLTKRGIPLDVVDAVLDRLTEVNLIDDEAFAELLVRSRINSRFHAKSRLFQELRQKGVSDEIAQRVLQQLTHDDELRLAKVAATKKLRTLQNVDLSTMQRRLAGYLGRKGFSSDVVWQTIQLVTRNTDSLTPGDYSLSES